MKWMNQFCRFVLRLKHFQDFRNEQLEKSFIFDTVEMKVKTQAVAFLVAFLVAVFPAVTRWAAFC